MEGKIDKKFALFLVHPAQRLELANEIVGDGNTTPQVLHEVFGWLVKNIVTDQHLYWKTVYNFVEIQTFIGLSNNQNLLVHNFHIFLKNAFLAVQHAPFDHEMVGNVEKVFEGVMHRIGGRVFNKLYFKFVLLVVDYIHSTNLVTNRVALSLIHKLFLSVLDIFVNTQQYKDILAQTVEMFLVPLLDLRKRLITELNQHNFVDATTEKKRDVDDGPSLDLEVEDTTILRTKQNSEDSVEQKESLKQFHAAGLNTPLDLKRVREITHAYATARITRSTVTRIGVEALESATSQYELLVVNLQMVETVLFFGLFHPDRVGLPFYARVNLNVFAQANLYNGLLRHLQSPSLAGIVGQGLGFILSAYNAGVNLTDALVGQRASVEGLDKFQQKPLSQRFFINLFFLLSTTKVEEHIADSGDESDDAGDGEVGEKRKRDDSEGKPTPRKKKLGRLDAKLTLLSNLLDETALRAPPSKMERLVERMRSLGNLFRVAGTIGTWQVEESPLITSTHKLVIETHSAALDSVEYMALDAAYDVFVGLQSMDHRGVTVPCCDELLGEITDFSAAARQLDSLFSYLFSAIRSETNFSSVYLAPKAIQKLCVHVGSLNAQIPPIWNLFLDEWKNENYANNIQKKSRFLFLFGIFIRSVQFLTTVGFTMDVLYDVFDRTLLIAKQALNEYEPDGSAESVSLFRSIVMFYSSIVVIARRINPFREGKSDEVMQQNEKILAKAFPKLLKHAGKLKAKQSKSKAKRLVLGGVDLDLCELMVYRLRDIAPSTSESFIEGEDNSEEVKQIRSLVSYIS